MNSSPYHFVFQTTVPIVRLVDEIIERAEKCGASDIHIDPRADDVRIRFRIDGSLHDVCTMPRATHGEFVARIKIISGLRIDERIVPQDGRLTVGESLDIRVTVIASYYGESIVMRLLRRTASVQTLSELGFSFADQEQIVQVLRSRQGLILVTGPTGSGKTTTLYSLLSLVNDSVTSVVTIEDPVEYAMSHVRQIQVQQKRGINFVNGLRSILRQDPDVIMVGEIRDHETAAIATSAALTGHLVLSTLHTNSAAGAMPRLLDMKVEAFLLVSTLDIVIAQRLVRHLAESKEKYFLDDAELASLGKLVNLDRILKLLIGERIVAPTTTWKQVPFYKPKKSPDAEDGYKGRIGINEVLKMTPTVKDLVMRGETADKIEAQAKTEGMVTMLEDGIFKAVQGETTIEEVLRVVTE